ncbi:kinase-like domain-containing protein [Mycena capillaripes]|nr:kinase-like domain-containing protein [Mycena capillaripes]
MAPIRTTLRSSSRYDPKPPTAYNHKRTLNGFTAGARFKPYYEGVHEGPEPYYYPLPLPVPEGIRPVDPRGPSLTLDDLECIRPLGDGANGHVLLVRPRWRTASKFFALKAVKKKDMRQRETGSLAGTISRERTALANMPWNPFVAGLLQTFHDSRNVYMMLEYSPCGTFSSLISTGESSISPAKMLFYFANIVCGLEHLEKCGLVNRDIKPGNIVVGVDGYLSLCDFGSALEISGGGNAQTWIGEGTQPYQAPEAISVDGQPDDLRYGTAVDWWSSGVVLYEMATGQLPFVSPNAHPKAQNDFSDSSPIPNDEQLNLIMAGPRSYPSKARVGRKLKALIKALLTVNANERLGAHGVQEVMQHPWLATVDWSKMRRKRYIPPALGLPPSGLSFAEKALDPKHYPGLHFAK